MRRTDQRATPSGSAHHHRTAGRAAVLLLAGTIGAWLAPALAVPAWRTGREVAAHGPLTTGDLPDLVAAPLLGLGAAVAAWYALTALIGLGLLVGGMTGPGGALRARVARVVLVLGAPALRRVAAAGTVATLSAGLVLAPASATVGAPGHVPAPIATLPGELPVVPGLGPVLDASAEDAAPALPPVPAVPDVDGPAAGTQEPAPGPDPEAAPAPEPPAPTDEGADGGATPASRVVTEGGSLWQVAAEDLGPDATPAEIAAAWPRWYEANAAVIGPEPDLVLVGTELVHPDLADQAPHAPHPTAGGTTPSPTEENR